MWHHGALEVSTLVHQPSPDYHFREKDVQGKEKDLKLTGPFLIGLNFKPEVTEYFELGKINFLLLYRNRNLRGELIYIFFKKRNRIYLFAYYYYYYFGHAAQLMGS